MQQYSSRDNKKKTYKIFFDFVNINYTVIIEWEHNKHKKHNGTGLKMGTYVKIP